jgi:putative oxidoreductase
MCMTRTAVKSAFATPWLAGRPPVAYFLAAMASGRSFGLLVARIALSGIFLYTGFENVQRIGETAAQLAKLGYPVAHVLAVLASIAELGGGISILLGALTPLGCLALILFLLPTTYSFHVPGMLEGNPMQTIETLKNLGLIGGLIVLLFSGPGRYSVDGRFMGQRS